MAQERPTVFEQLKTFLTRQMRMSHLYQPLMLRTLIDKGGFASLRDIASSFLAHDESQLEYYVEITKRMPGPVLSRHEIVRRDGAGYRLIPDVQQLTREQRDELLRLCDEAVENYAGRRGRKLYDHRRIALGDISGTARYEVLRRAGFRCDLCGSQRRKGRLRSITSCRDDMGAPTTSQTFRRFATSATPIRVPAMTVTCVLFGQAWPIGQRNASFVALATVRSSRRTNWPSRSTMPTRSHHCMR